MAEIPDEIPDDPAHIFDESCAEKYLEQEGSRPLGSVFEVRGILETLTDELYAEFSNPEPDYDAIFVLLARVSAMAKRAAIEVAIPGMNEEKRANGSNFPVAAELNEENIK